MKAVLSNRILIELSKDQFEVIRPKLSYELPSLHSRAKPEKIKQYLRLREGLYSIPIGRIDLIPEGHEIVDKRACPSASIPELNVTLRDKQKEIVDSVSGNSIVLAKVGFGKTIVALAIAHKLQLKTLIVVHNLMLRDQWVSEIKKLMGISPSIIGSGKRDTSSAITVANVQTLVKFANDLNQEFGLVIVDEAHKIPSTTFTNIIDTLKAKVKIGLTGTLARKDKKDMFIPDFFTVKDIYEPPRENTLVPKIYIINTNIKFKFNPLISGAYSKEINSLVDNPDYRKLCYYLCSLYQDKNHKVLFISDRVDFLNNLANDLPEYRVVTGATTQEEREEYIKEIYEDKVSGILGSISIFKEGISINPLSCLILGTPISGKNLPMLEQLIGRVTRQHPNKKQPIVVDIQLEGGIAKKQCAERVNYYLNLGYQVQNFTLDIGEHL